MKPLAEHPVAQPIFKYLNPVFGYIDGGNFFRYPLQWFYYFLGIATCIGMIYGIVQVFDYASVMSGAAYVFAFLMMLVFIACGIISLFYWFRRGADVINLDRANQRYHALRVGGGLIIDFGEWMGIMGMIICSCCGILWAIFISIAAKDSNQIWFGLFGVGFCGTLFSYLWIIFSRTFGEYMMAFSSIANNVEKIANK